MRVRIVALLAVMLAALPGLSQAQTPAAPGRHPAAAARAPAAPAGPALIDVNTADERALDALPGVGPVRARAIVANRPYTDKQQLVTKKALPANVLAAIQDRIALINVNVASAADMARTLPNVGPVRAAKIVAGRPYATLSDLVTKGALTQGVLEGIRGLVTTGG